MYTSGALVFAMSVARVTVIRLKETPKYLLGEGKDAQLVADFQAMAQKYNRPCSITLEQLEACGTLRSAHGKSKVSVSELTIHFRGLFSSKKTAISTILVWLSWTLIVSCSRQYFDAEPSTHSLYFLGPCLSTFLRIPELVSCFEGSFFQCLYLRYLEKLCSGQYFGHTCKI
jgi:hypothetical protein